jgi:hypothetical protein
MASVKTNTASSREEIAQQIAAQIMSGLSSNSSKSVSISDRLFQYASNKIADSGNGVAELASGFKAAANNFEIAKNAADVRQAQRTAGKVARLVELELQARGL